jgi:hypothetical protein
LHPQTPDFYGAFVNNKLKIFYPFEWFAATFDSILVFNICWLVAKYLNRKTLSFRKRMGIILFTIIVCSMLASIPLNYLGNKYLGRWDLIQKFACFPIV